MQGNHYSICQEVHKIPDCWGGNMKPSAPLSPNPVGSAKPGIIEGSLQANLGAARGGGKSDINNIINNIIMLLWC